jgi:hypothetical protein
MEVLMQMPDRGPDNISWRRKETRVIFKLLFAVHQLTTACATGNPVGRVVHRGLAWLRELRHCGMQGRMGVEGEEGDRRNAE